MTDRSIIELLEKRDEEGLREAERQYGQRLRRIAERLLSKEDAEECVNDVFLALWNHVPPEKPENLMAYMTVILKNNARNRWSAEKAVKRNAETEASPQGPRRMKKVWIPVLAAAVLILATVGTVILIRPWRNVPEDPGTRVAEQNGTFYEGEEKPGDPEEGHDTVDPEAAFQTGGARAFSILYTEYLDELMIGETTDTDKIAFFENYGGSCLDDEGQLTVYYKKGSEASAKKVQAYVEEKAGCSVTFKPAEYSLKDLKAYKEQFFEITKTWGEQGFTDLYEAILGVGIDQENNCLRVNLKSVSEKESARLRTRAFFGLYGPSLISGS